MLLQKVLREHTVDTIAKSLNVYKRTVGIWISNNNKSPVTYDIDLLKMLGEKVDYSSYSFSDKDQFFTPIETVRYCLKVCENVMMSFDDRFDKYYCIEPSAGDGSFLHQLPENRRIGMDIEPRSTDIITQDFLTWKPVEHKRSKKQPFVIIGNPPFGKRGQLALRFINKAYELGAEYVCFVLPPIFESDGKGSPRFRTPFNLIHTEKLKNSLFYYPNKQETHVDCIFQVWSKYNTNNRLPKVKINNTHDIIVYSISDGGTSASTRNKKMVHKCDVYLPSTCYGKRNMRPYHNFNDLPCNRGGYGIQFLNDTKQSLLLKFHQINWSEKASLSVNGSYNIRRSTILSQLI
jgi:hypothetical protein